VNDPPDISKLLGVLSDVLSGNLGPALDAIDTADPQLQLDGAVKVGIGLAHARANDAPIPEEAKVLLAAMAAAPVARQCFRMVRESVGITQPEIAEKCGVRVETVSHWETGYSPLPVDAMAALFEILASRVKPPPALTGSDIARLRRSLGMRQIDFAAAVGVSVPTVKYWEKHGLLPVPAASARRVRDYAVREGIDLTQLAA